ncbi:4-hydroxybenzoate polyprenyltransferase [Halovenus aranensis]|uniref:4-hydroxybenzoate polyprenyltransferase n=1 Tax=Halovenus aranensis TaxID=890420 RepID=A0A1G8S7M1_9EURY|nr:prenyltransferase [Halovenus aranensis]SDJ25197.1 4-hydroxybenzoate polyprenyltransferase [Halovenus aranensis]
MSDVTERLKWLAPSERTFAGYLFWLSRPRFWLYLAGPVIVGVAYGAPTTSEFFTPLSIALFLYFLLPANVFLYGVNDRFDVDIDEYNPKKSEGGREVQYSGSNRVTAIVLVCGALGVGFVPVLPAESAVAMGAFLTLGAAYSVPPLRFKTTPVLDSVSNGLYVTPAIVAYGGVAGTAPPLLAVAGGWVWAMGMHTFSAIPDIDPDRRAGITTTATLLGERATLLYCAACWLAAAALMGVVDPRLGVVFLVYPLFVGVIDRFGVDIARAYWWFPILNTFAGMALTMGRLWVMLYG